MKTGFQPSGFGTKCSEDFKLACKTGNTINDPSCKKNV